MRKNLGSALALLLAIISNGGTMAQTQTLEQKIWTILDDSKAAYVSLGEADFRALGAGFDLPDSGKSIARLAEQAPGGAFDPRDVAKLAPQQLGYKADWIVERFRRYNLDWDITGLRLESLDPEAKSYPWFIVMNGGAANFYEFFVDLKNRPGWTQYLAQKLNIMIVTIPGNFKYGGWEQPVADVKRQPAYLFDRDLSTDEYEVRNAIFTNSLIMQGLKALVTKHTSGDILLIGHSTSGELSMLAYCRSGANDGRVGPVADIMASCHASTCTGRRNWYVIARQRLLAVEATSLSDQGWGPVGFTAALAEVTKRQEERSITHPPTVGSVSRTRGPARLANSRHFICLLESEYAELRRSSAVNDNLSLRGY